MKTKSTYLCRVGGNNRGVGKKTIAELPSHNLRWQLLTPAACFPCCFRLSTRKQPCFGVRMKSPITSSSQEVKQLESELAELEDRRWLFIGSIICRWRYWFWMLACYVFHLAKKVFLLQNNLSFIQSKYCHLTLLYAYIWLSLILLGWQSPEGKRSRVRYLVPAKDFFLWKYQPKWMYFILALFHIHRESDL